MKSLITRIGFSILTASFILILINGCKKNDVANNDAESSLEKSKAWAAKQPKFTTHIVNQKLESYYVDENDNRITASQKTSGTGTGCEATLDPDAIFNSWAATDPQCSPSGSYQIYAVFTISSQNAIVPDDPNSSFKTRGRVIITNTSTGASVYTNQSVLPTTITDIGVDPSRASHRLYRVTWTAQNLPSSIFNGSNTINIGVYYYSECEDESRWARLAIANISNLGGLTACNVVNYVTVDRINHYLHGNAAVSTCLPDLAPNYHEVEFTRTGFTYSKVLGLTETYQPNATELPRGHTYTVRYRNQAGSNISSPSCYGPWIAPTLSV